MWSNFDPRDKQKGKSLAIISIFSATFCHAQLKKVNMELKSIFGSSNIHLDQVLANKIFLTPCLLFFLLCMTKCGRKNGNYCQTFAHNRLYLHLIALTKMSLVWFVSQIDTWRPRAQAASALWASWWGKRSHLHRKVKRDHPVTGWHNLRHVLVANFLKIRSSKCVCWVFCDIRNENAVNLVSFSKTTSFSIFNWGPRTETEDRGLVPACPVIAQWIQYQMGMWPTSKEVPAACQPQPGQQGQRRVSAK